MEFKDKIKTLRMDKKLTQKEVAEAAGITTRAYIEYEKGATKPRKRETYEKLAKVLGCNAEYLEKDDFKVPAKLVSTLSSLAGGTAAAGIAFGGIPLGVSMILYALAGGGFAASEYMKKNEKARKELEELLKEQTTSEQEAEEQIPSDGITRFVQKQEQFKIAAMGIITSALAKKGIISQMGVPVEEQIGMAKPESSLKIIDQNISNWWFSFYAKDEELERFVHTLNDDRAEIMISKYSTAKPDPTRMVTIVVDQEKLFNELCSFKDNNSYRGNMSVVLLDLSGFKIVKEEIIAKYTDDTHIIEII